MKPGKKLSYTKLSCLSYRKDPVHAPDRSMITFTFLYPLLNSPVGLEDHEQAYFSYCWLTLPCLRLWALIRQLDTVEVRYVIWN